MCYCFIFLSHYDHRVPNEAIPGKIYSVVHYLCDPGYASPSLKMYCSEGQWKGKQPQCVNQDEVDEEQGENCSQPEAAKCPEGCAVQDGRATCQCREGFQFDGFGCHDVDECAEDNGGCEHVCSNKPGTVLCSCRSGFTLAEDGKSCVDDNECSLNNGHGPCQDICTNTPGGYQCSCQSSILTILAPDGHSCQSSDDCSLNNGGCSHKCIDSYSQVFCLCPEGFSLASDWKTCKDVDECQTDNGGCEQMCVNEPGNADFNSKAVL